MTSHWLRRRWVDFRQGHNFYLIFMLSFANFILIFHRLLIERIPSLNELFSNLWIFTVIFVIVYIPLAILIGVWHRKTQIKIESEQHFRHNPFMARNFRMIVDILDGKASKEEVEEFRHLLEKIEKGKGSAWERKK